jgi:protoporphyrinogen oxidase
MIVIIGGGLAGMSTAYHLGDVPHVVLEAETTPGGLCRTREVDGFHFDYTGHLLHLRDQRIVRLVDELLPGAFRLVERRAAIRTHGATLPFPFQANLHGLPAERVADCITGFVEALQHPVPDAPDLSFEDWSLAVFGSGISDLFMFPYNRKLFRREPREMTADWVSWAVPRPSLNEVVRGALGLENQGMGYNPTFRYPERGGIGILPRALAERVSHLRRGERVTEVDLDRRRVTLAGGETIDYEALVVTTPLPGFLRMTRGGPAGLDELSARLDWSVVGCLNLGIDRPDIADGEHWIYFPDDDTPFYRVGFPSNFSETVAPAGASSMYVEFGLRRDEAFDPKRLETQALAALRREKILHESDRILARDWVRVDPGYVIFDKARQEVMARVEPGLARHGVHLIGRYGAWTYSYMERALLDGLELAAKIRAGAGQRI